MQVVIDIPEKMYEDCKVRNTLHYSPYDFSSMIVNGTILPKGHGKLIDASKLEVGEVYDDEGNLCGTVYATKYDIDNAQTIIEADEELSE